MTKITGIVIVRGADFQVVVLDQFVEVPTLDDFQLELYITRLIAYLLTGEALANIAANTASDARPRVTFLNPSHHFRNALVSHGVVRTEQDFVLVQLRHDDHARTFVLRALGRGVLHLKDTIFVDKQQILFLAKVVTCDLTHVLRKDVVVYGLALHQFLLNFFSANTWTSRFWAKTKSLIPCTV